jgi:DNA-binding transcriptional LysR family regulator
MDLNDALVFVRVVEAQSFTKAAERLGLPKSVVSRRVSSLEEGLGVRLLRRTTRSLNLTDAGAAYFARARQGLDAFGEAENAVRDMHGAPRGIVRISAPQDLGGTVIPWAIAEFTKKHPGIAVDAVFTPRRVDLVSEGFDLALRFGKLDDSSLLARRIGTIDHALVASRAFLKAHGTPSAVSDLAKMPCILFRSKTMTDTWILTGPEGTKKVQVSGVLVGDDFTYLRELAVAGGGIALLPWFFGEPDVTRKRLERVLPEYGMRGVDFHIVYPESRFMPQRISLLLDFLADKMMLLCADPRLVTEACKKRLSPR